MKVCSDIKRRIDEADQPDQPGLEIAQHTARCAACREFAEQRTLLRSLVTVGGRVSAPVNFDAMLHARLAEIKARKSFAWFSPTVYLRFGAATAAIVVAICAAQYSNLFATDQPLIATIPDAAKQLSPRYTPPPVAPPTRDPMPEFGSIPTSGRMTGSTPVVYSNAGRNLRRYATTRAALVSDNSVPLDDSSVIIMRGSNGEREIAIKTFSVGAQSLLYGNAGHQPPPARPIGVSSF
jgi:hypothetical protein